MKRGENAGGGQSSLGYLFGSENKDKNGPPPRPPYPPPISMPPYGIDYMGDDDKPPEIEKRRHHGQKNSGVFITVSKVF